MKILVKTLFLVLVSGLVLAEEPAVLVIEPGFVSRSLENDFQYYRDEEASMDLEKVRTQRFSRLYEGKINLGYTSSAYWFHLGILNQSDNETFVIESKNPRVDELDFYLVDETGVVKQLLSGDTRGYKQRSLDTPFLNFAFDIARGKSASLYIRARNSNSLNLPVQLNSMEAYVASTGGWQFASGMFYGLAIGLLLYNLFLFVFLRERSYFYYCLSVLMTVLFFAVFDGYAYRFWPENANFQQYAAFVFAPFAAVFILLFSRHYLDLQRESLEDRIIKYNLYACIAFLLCMFFLEGEILTKLVTVVSCSTVASVIGISILRFNQGFRPALHSLAAWSLLLVSVFFAALGVFGIDIPYLASISFIKLGFVFQLTILSVGLAYRINLLKKERALADKQIQVAEMEGENKIAFLARMSHEIRTPMTGILGIIQLLQDTPVDKQQKEYLETLKSSTDSLVDIINDILDYSRLQTGSLTLEVIPFELVKLVNECVSIFSVTLTEKQIRLAVNVSKKLPAVVCGDPTRVKQILFNLVSNAVKFTEKGQILISVDAESPGYHYGDSNVSLRFTIEDTGSGIGDDKLETIFDIFSASGSNLQQNSGRAGLGLAICKELTEAMGGSIGVESEENRGSTFWFTVNLGVVNEKNHDFYLKNQNQEPLNDKVDDFHGVHCLVVDDNQVNKMVLIRILTGLGAICTSASDGEEAVDAYNEQRDSIDIVFMDCEMPGLDGFAAAETIRELEKNFSHDKEEIPIIAITAHVHDDYRQKCFSAGMNEHLPKPVAKEKIVETMRKWVVHEPAINQDFVRH